MKVATMDTPNHRRCSRCRKVFKSRKAADQHIQAIHKGRGERVPVTRDSEESLADIFVEGQINRDSGVPNPGWLEDMIPSRERF